MTRTFLRTIQPIIAALALASCVSEADVPDTPSDKPGSQCSFSVVLQLTDDRLLSTPAGEYSPGTGYENYIDLTQPSPDIKLSLYETNNAFICNVDKPIVTSLEYDGKGSKRYLLEFDVTEDFYNRFNKGSFKLVILANFDRTYPSAGTLADLWTKPESVRDYSSLPGPALTASDKIAMYGVSRFDNVEFNPSHSISLGSIHLIRALAKVEVFDHVESTMPIKTVVLTRHNRRSYSVPSGVLHQNDYVKNSYDGDYIDHITADGAYESADPVPFGHVELDGKRHYLLYIPEYANLNANGTPRAEAERARLKVSYDDRDFYLDFQTPGGPIFNISRNLWYRFALNRKEANISIETQVVPYNEKELKIGFGLSSGLNLVPIMDNNGKVVYYYDPMTGDYYGPDRTTKIPNPYIDRDPVTGWNLTRDMNGQLICYYDAKNGKFYGWDKKTEILQPSANIDKETGWYTIIRAADNVILYYYDTNSSIWYMPDKKTKVEEPFK